MSGKSSNKKGKGTSNKGIEMDLLAVGYKVRPDPLRQHLEELLGMKHIAVECVVNSGVRYSHKCRGDPPSNVVASHEQMQTWYDERGPLPAHAKVQKVFLEPTTGIVALELRVDNELFICFVNNGDRATLNLKREISKGSKGRWKQFEPPSDMPLVKVTAYRFKNEKSLE